MRVVSKASTLNSSYRSRSQRWDPLTELSVGDLSTGTDVYLNERDQVAVTQPDVVKEFLCPVSPELKDFIIGFRDQLTDELQNLDPNPSTRFIISGPRYLDDSAQAEACAKWLLVKSGLEGVQCDFLRHKKLPDKLRKLFRSNSSLNNLKFAMNLNISEERKYVCGSYMTKIVVHGVVNCRTLVMKLAEIIPIAGNIGDPIGCHYVDDLFSLGLLSSANIESQTHRELASGVPFPVGFDSSTPQTFCESLLDHKIRKATDAILSSSDPHYFLSMTDLGTVAIASTIGNKDSFLVLQIQYNTVLLDLVHITGIINRLLENINYPKIFLDVGKVSSGNIKGLLDLIASVLKSSISQYIIGFIIDSGNQYVPDDLMEGYTELINVKEEEESFNEMHQYSPISECLRLRRVSAKNKFFSTMKSSYTKFVSNFDNKTLSVYQYQNFVYADRLINEIDRLISLSKNS